MQSTVESPLMKCALRLSLPGLAALATPVLILTTGCGATTNMTPKASSTSVTLVATSFANDRWTNVTLGLNKVTLIGQSGEKAELLSAPVNVEFTHLTSASEPVATVEVPQGTYTGATVDLGSATDWSSGLGPSSGLDTTGGDRLAAPLKNIAVHFPNPIAVTGDSMSVSLSMLVNQSLATESSSSVAPSVTFSPEFVVSVAGAGSLTSEQAAAPMVSLQGVVSGGDGASSLKITSLDGSNPDNLADTGGLQASNAPEWTVNVNADTAFEGISSLVDVAAGVPVDVDLALTGGSLTATRIAVYDTNPENLTLWDGALLQVQPAQTMLVAAQRAQQGPIGNAGMAQFNYGSANFAISGAIGNLAQLPFNAVFNSANMVPGQLVNLTSHNGGSAATGAAPAVSTMTLMPQTIDGNIASVSQQGNFTVYTVYLAPYDPLAALATQPGQANLLTNPSIVQVYASASTPSLAFYPAKVGGVNRFYGLVFNDNGTLRMDCARIQDGVTE